MKYQPQDDEKLREDCDTCRIIEGYLEQKVSGSDKPIGQIVEEFAEYAEVSASIARRHLDDSRRKLVTKISPRVPGKKDLYLQRLATLYEFLDIRPDDEIVELTQKVNNSFKYTPGLYRQPQAPKDK